MPATTAQWLYALLALIGTVLPLSQLLPWLLVFGPDARLLIDALLATDIGRFLAAGALLTALAVLVFVVVEGRRLVMRDLWLPILATILIGASLGLPLFLYMRERHMAAT